MTDDVCVACSFRDKVACACCWSRLVISSEKELVDDDLSDADLWACVGVDFEP